MLKHISSGLILTIFLTAGQLSFGQAAKKLPVDSKRSANWKPEKGQYYFSHALTFEYQNKEEKTKGEIVVYLDPVSGAMCFRKETSFGNSGKSYDFIIGMPDGKYIYCGIDKTGKKIRSTEIIEEVKPDAEEKAQQKEDFDTYCIPTANKRVDFGWESQEYDLNYATSETKDKIWLTRVPFNTYPLYAFELIEATASLPVSFDFTHLFDPTQLLTEMNSEEAFIKLKSVEPNSFLANINVYEAIKTE
jgi:hypothetical protein